MATLAAPARDHRAPARGRSPRRADPRASPRADARPTADASATPPRYAAAAAAVAPGPPVARLLAAGVAPAPPGAAPEVATPSAAPAVAAVAPAAGREPGGDAEPATEPATESATESATEGATEVARDGPATHDAADVVDEGDPDGVAATGLPAAGAEATLVPLDLPPLAPEPLDSAWSATAPDAAELQPPAGPGPAPAAATSDAVEQPTDGRGRAESDRQAAQRALQAWLGLARELHGEHERLAARGHGAVQGVVQAWQGAAEAIRQGFEQDRGELDQALLQAAAVVHATGEAALADFRGATQRTRRAIDAAGRQASGLIRAGSGRAASQITAVVAGLVAGHRQAYDDAIADAQAACDLAVETLNLWRDERELNYSTEAGEALERASNEKRQRRIPRWADDDARAMQQRFDTQAQSWQTSRDNTACSLSCSYGSALEAENARMAAQSECQVGQALGTARGQLSDQARAGRQTLRDITHQHQQQLQVQGAAARSRLHSRARSALAARHREAQGAAQGLGGATQAALPAYAQAAQAQAQALRDAAQRGAATLDTAASRGAEPVLARARRSAAQVDARLAGQASRHQARQDTQAHEHADARTAEREGWASAIEGLQTAHGETLSAAAAGVTQAFGGLADSVRAAATQWAQPLPQRMAGFIAGKRQEADAALQQLLTGAAAASTDTAPAPAAAGDACAEAGPAAAPASCSGCGGGAGAGEGGEGGDSPGLIEQVDEEVLFYEERLDPDTLFADRLDTAASEVEQALAERASRASQALEAGVIDKVDESALLDALRGMTANQGEALDGTVYVGQQGRSLSSDLAGIFDSDDEDYLAALDYLRGDNAAGAARELADSTGFFNDDEARIERVMRSLSPDELAALGTDHADTMGEVRDALGGTDLEVFDALADGDHALADAHRLRDAVADAQRDFDADAVHRAIEQYTGAPPPGDWRAEQEEDADSRRSAVVDALGGILTDAEIARGLEPGTDAGTVTSHEERALAFVRREVDRHVGEGQVVSFRLAGANEDLAAALMTRPADSVEVRAARLGVEIQRRGDPPDAAAIDRATFDPRFAVDLTSATPAQRQAHAEAAADRARMLMLAAERYAGGEAAPEDWAPAGDAAHPEAAMDEGRVTDARDRLIGSLEARFGANSTGAELAAGLLTDARPSPETVAIAMEHAMEGAGTNEDLLFRFTERMDRDEIARMRQAYQGRTGRSLDADLGVYGEGGFGEVSGDDRLRMERALLGQPRNDRERLEAAAFALEQQRREAGSFGAWLAEGSRGERALQRTQADLELLAGGPLTVGRRGTIEGGLGNFAPDGSYRGPDAAHFRATAGAAQQIASAYSARIDAFANVATTGIAVLGAIAAAAITVITGGAAAPLIAAALVTGLASMSAQYALKGGRYGWEQAAVDLGMTAVQAVTAGVGAQLGAAAQIAGKTTAAASAASRTLTSLARIFTGNPVVDQIIVGMITGAIGGIGGAALDERTWAHGSDDAVGWLFAGLLRGALAGGATAAATNGLEALARNGAGIAAAARRLAERSPGLAGRAVGGLGRGLARGADAMNDALSAGTGGGLLRSAGAVARRSVARGAVQSVGAMAGRSVELSVDTATGRFKGDLGEALGEVGHAGGQAFLQGLGEGAAEALGAGAHARRLARAQTEVARVRSELGLEALPPHALSEAAGDLLFMQQHGRFGSDAVGRWASLEHVATHGGLAATRVQRGGDPIVEAGMRAALARHVDAGQHAMLADVEIRVLSDAEFRQATRSELGDAVTLIEHGRPVVVVREGADIARLADEGPHLVQQRDAAHRDRVARLDEATLARWDTLDLDTQLALYGDKLTLELDAHAQVQRSLEAELADAVAHGDARRIADAASELQRNAGTLADLHRRAADVDAMTPGRRTDIAEGRLNRPDFLDQPARLFSKRRRAPPPEEALVDDILETMLTEIGEKRRMAAGGGRVDAALQDLPDAVQSFLRRGERMPGRPEVPAEVKAWARRVARERFGTRLQDALTGHAPHDRMTMAAVDFLDDVQIRFVMDHGRLPPDVEFHHLLPVADFPEFAHLAEVGTAMPKDLHREAGHAGDTTRPLEAGTLLDPGAVDRPIGLHNDPEAQKHHRPRQAEIAEGTRSTRDVDRDLVIDFGQRVREAEAALARAERRAAQRPGAANAERVHQARQALDAATGALAEVQARVGAAAAMRAALGRHLPPDQQALAAEVPIRILPEAEFRRLTRSALGDAVTLIVDGQPLIAVREGTPPARVADEGPHLAQLADPATRAAVLALDETVLARWDTLDLDTQISLTATKLRLELDAHRRIDAALRQAAPPDAAEIARNDGTLRSLEALHDRVRSLGPAERAAMRADPLLRPDILAQPARLFSKRARGDPAVVFEPFVGPDLASPIELGSRHAGARIIAAEASHPPSPDDVAGFEAAGGRFVPERFGESLPDASVDRIHARFPLPHDKAQEMVLDTQGRSLDEAIAEVAARQAAVESLTNLAPHALRLLREGGEIEVVFDEASILREVQAAQGLVFTDAQGRRWRLEPTAPAMRVDRAATAPHSGFGVPANDTAHRVTLRKVRVPPTEAERADARAGRAARRASERQARDDAAAARRTRAAEAERARTDRRSALRERGAILDAETRTRLEGLRSGHITADELLRRQLAPVAAATRLDVDGLLAVIRGVDTRLGGEGRRIDAQEIVDSLRARVRDGRPPRHGELDGLVDELALTLNAQAVGLLREHITGLAPDAVLAVQRGGALLAEVLARDTAGFPDTVMVDKTVTARPGRRPLVQRTPGLEAEIRRRIGGPAGQRRFVIVDVYMGGVFADELLAMVRRIAADHPDVRIDALWLRETIGFERLRTRPTLEDLREGVFLSGRPVLRDGRLVIAVPSAALTLPPLAGTDPTLPQLRAAAWPVDIVLGDDMPSALDATSTRPVRIFDREGRIVRTIAVGERDPATGERLRSTRDIVVRLMQGHFTIGPDDEPRR